MKITKTTYGFVQQVFDTKKKQWVSQEFVAGDQCEYENEIGDSLDSMDAEDKMPKDKRYLPFDMVSPEKMKELEQLIYDDLSCILDGQDDLLEYAAGVLRDRLIVGNTGPAPGGKPAIS